MTESTSIEKLGKLVLDPVERLGKYGLIGVMLLLITAVIISMGFLYRISTYHMTKTNESNLKVAEAITELSTIIKLPNRISQNN